MAVAKKDIDYIANLNIDTPSVSRRTALRLVRIARDLMEDRDTKDALLRQAVMDWKFGHSPEIVMQAVDTQIKIWDENG